MTDTMRPASDPTVVVVDPDGAASETAAQMRDRYGCSYGITVVTDTEQAADQLRRSASEQREVALVLADRATGGTEVLELVRTLHPRARRALLLDWNDSRTCREEISSAFARRNTEGIITKPIGARDERFHRSVTEFLDEWWRLNGSPNARVQIIGAPRSPRVYEMCDLLQRHDVPYTLNTPDSPAGSRALRTAGAAPARCPVVIVDNGQTLVDPTNIEVADALGARTRPRQGLYDVIVVGGGPAGLSAAVYAESEGLRTALIEPTAMGGQAGMSSMIRNYLGFPRGISGTELAARAFEQAILFGTEMIYGTPAAALRAEGDLLVITLADGTDVPGRSVVIATGASYRRLGVPSLEALNGRGVYYGAAMSEAPSFVGQDVYVVGGGNSAGQAAVHLARYANRVTILVRRESLAASMSEYLITEINATPNLIVHYCIDVVGGGGADELETLELRDRRAGADTSVAADALFVLIGAQPFTEWLPPDVIRDEWGYIITGPTDDNPRRLQFESLMEGVFAVGDVRRDSIKRVASAVGEGAVCVRLLHDYLESHDAVEVARI